MGVDVVVDLQFGSTAKGKLCQHLAISHRQKYEYSVRVQSIQAGHTVIFNGKEYKMRTIPCAWVNPEVVLVLGPGCFILKQLLLDEIDMLEADGIPIRNRLVVDYRAFYVLSNDQLAEDDNKLTDKIGSTAEGAGSSLIRKLWRNGSTRVQDDDWAMKNGINIGDTIKLIQDSRVLLEGCQGTLLSIHTSPYYPYVTSRECTVAGICSEAGIAPKDIDKVYGVFRTFPIRVGGNSGDTGGRELTWEEVAWISGNPHLIPERTTVTKRERRIFTLDTEDLLHSIMVNKPDFLVLTFLDYINYHDTDKMQWSELSRFSCDWIKNLEVALGQPIDLISTGKDPNSWVHRPRAIGG